ncbi:MAG TPA: LytTR family DNA-binding domain-containing protein [Nakamurella sp.]
MRPGVGDQARSNESATRPTGLTVLAVDDEAPALDEVAYLLRGDPRVGTILTAGNAAEAMALLTRTDEDTPVPDAVLLDIAMPGWDGVDLARVLSGLPRPPAVAFLSAHDNRAVEAYEIGAVDYLLKPVRAARLAEAVTRFCAARDAAVQVDRRRSTGTPAGESDRPAAPAVADPGQQDVMIAVDLAGSTRFVPRSSVCWAEAQGDYARLHVTGGGSHLIRTPLAVLQEEWAPAGFVRVHRGYLVALNRIVELRSVDGGYRILVSGQPTVADLPVSRRHLRTLKQQLLAGRRPGR